MSASFMNSLAGHGSSPIADTEDVLEEAARAGADKLTDLLDTIMPDGRPFGMEKQTPQEEAGFYVEHLRGNVLGWDAWRDSRRGMVLQMLSDVRPELMDTINLDHMIDGYTDDQGRFHPGYSQIYSAEMEALVVKYNLAPPAPIPFPQMPIPIPSPFLSPTTNMAPPIPFPSPTTNSAAPPVPLNPGMQPYGPQ